MRTRFKVTRAVQNGLLIIQDLGGFEELPEYDVSANIGVGVSGAWISAQHAIDGDCVLEITDEQAVDSAQSVLGEASIHSATGELHFQDGGCSTFLAVFVNPGEVRFVVYGDEGPRSSRLTFVFKQFSAAQG